MMAPVDVAPCRPSPASLTCVDALPALTAGCHVVPHVAVPAQAAHDHTLSSGMTWYRVGVSRDGDDGHESAAETGSIAGDMKKPPMRTRLAEGAVVGLVLCMHLLMAGQLHWTASVPTPTAGAGPG